MNIEELIKEYKEHCKESKKRFEDELEETKKGINELLDGASCVICLTNKGQLEVGSEDEILTCISQLVNSLYFKNNINKELILNAVKIGLLDNEELKKDTFNKLEELIDKLGE